MSAPESTTQPASEHRTHGWYVYGIVPADVMPNEDAHGVADAKLDVVQHGDTAALVSEIDISRPLGLPEDLIAHEQLLDAATAEAPVLPLRFGAVVSSREAITGELLGPHYDEFAKALRQLEGCMQYLVKGRYVEETILNEALSENSEAARLREEIHAAGHEDATRNERIRLGEIITDAVNAKREADTRMAVDTISSYCIATSVREPANELDAANVAALIKKARQADLEKAVDKLAHDWKGRVNLRLMGPMAPWDFVTTYQPGS
jgi:hypothetical protein